VGPLPDGAAPVRARAGAGRVGRPHPSSGRSDRAERAGTAHRERGAAFMNLAETQARFWAALRGEAVETAFLKGEDRLHVYADMFLNRQIDALREDFPETERSGEKKNFLLLPGS